jgi:hypothetical protein
VVARRQYSAAKAGIGAVFFWASLGLPSATFAQTQQGVAYNDLEQNALRQLDAAAVEAAQLDKVPAQSAPWAFVSAAAVPGFRAVYGRSVGQSVGQSVGMDQPIGGSQTFTSGSTATPWVRVPEGNFGYLEGSSTLHSPGDEATYDPEQPFAVLRSAVGYSAGIRQVIDFGRPGASVSVGYRYDSGDVGDDWRAFDRVGLDSRDTEGREVQAGLGWKFGGAFGASALYAYRRDPERFGTYSKEHRIRLELTRDLSEWLHLRAAFLHRVNDSNRMDYERGRYLASLGFEARF